MPYRLSLATDDERGLVIEAMRAAASTRSRAAAKASAATMADKRAGKDVRARSVRLVALLAEAADLERLALELEQAEELPLVVEVAGRPQLAAVVTAAEAGVTLAEQVEQLDAGAAPELDAAHRIAEADRLADLAGLKPALTDDGTVVEDEHGIAPEDVPGDDDVVDVDLSAGELADLDALAQADA